MRIAIHHETQSVFARREEKANERHTGNPAPKALLTTVLEAKAEAATIRYASRM
jgi:hypothetical protein